MSKWLKDLGLFLLLVEFYMRFITDTSSVISIACHREDKRHDTDFL